VQTKRTFGDDVLEMEDARSALEHLGAVRNQRSAGRAIALAELNRKARLQGISLSREHLIIDCVYQIEARTLKCTLIVRLVPAVNIIPPGREYRTSNRRTHHGLENAKDRIRKRVQDY
jgi:hypothetical protein